MDREWLEKLLDKTDIIKLISRYVPLKRKGGNFWGCCPFHHEKEPSFSVTEEKQFYHCFGCKESGNAIMFLQKVESIDFIDAVRILADEVGMEVPSFNSNGKNVKLEREKRDRLYALMRDAARHYHSNLTSPQAQSMNEYLVKRNIPKSLVIKFGLGASLNYNEMIDYLASKGYTNDEMKQAGIADIKADRYYDVFGTRLMFPIINNFNEVVAFGGRTLSKDTNFAKYRNSSQTDIFDKSRTVYGINLLKKKKQSGGQIPYVIMVEGYMDVIALHKAGFDTAVASMGTALTKEQAKLIKNYSTKVYISYDGDTAGQKATMRGLDIMNETGLNVKIVSLPQGLDPDDIISKFGADAYNDLLTKSQTLPEFKINVLLRNYDLTLTDEKSKFAVEAIRVVKALPNPVEQEEYLTLVQKLTGYSTETLRKQAELPDQESKTPVAKVNNEAISSALSDKAATFIMASIANAVQYADMTEDIYPYLNSQEYREIYSFVLDRIRGGNYNPSKLYTLETVDKSLIDALINYDFVQGDNAEKYTNCVNTLKSVSLLGQKTTLLEQYKKDGDNNLLNEIKKIDLKLNQMKIGGGQYD